MVLVTGSQSRSFHTRLCTLQYNLEKQLYKTDTIFILTNYKSTTHISLPSIRNFNNDIKRPLERKYPRTTVDHRSSQRPQSISITRYQIKWQTFRTGRISRTKGAKLAKFRSRHKELDKKVEEIKTSLAREQKTLAELTAQTKTLQASTKKQEKNELASINVRIDNLITAATPIREEIVTIMAQLLEKRTEGKAARDAEAKATLRSTILLECHQSNGKVFIKAMKKYYEFSDCKSTKDNCNIGPQTEAILLVFYDIPCFFSQMELEVFLGYVSPNHNEDGALIKMVEKEMLVKATNKVGTPIYYLGTFAMQALDRTKITDVDARQPSRFAQIADTELETKDKLQQEDPPATNDKSHQHQKRVQKRVVSHHREK
jgi:hypothetical protein